VSVLLFAQDDYVFVQSRMRQGGFTSKQNIIKYSCVPMPRRGSTSCSVLFGNFAVFLFWRADPCGVCECAGNRKATA
jgi:hypothetical protein